MYTFETLSVEICIALPQGKKYDVYRLPLS